MKLNATTEMMPVTWPSFANMHPFAPTEQAEGFQVVRVFLQLEPPGLSFDFLMLSHAKVGLEYLLLYVLSERRTFGMHFKLRNYLSCLKNNA